MEKSCSVFTISYPSYGQKTVEVDFEQFIVYTRETAGDGEKVFIINLVGHEIPYKKLPGKNPLFLVVQSSRTLECHPVMTYQ